MKSTIEQPTWSPFAALPFLSGAAEADANRQIQEEIKQDANDDWASSLYDWRTRERAADFEDEAIISTSFPNEMIEVMATETGLTAPEVQQIVEQHVQQREQQIDAALQQDNIPAEAREDPLYRQFLRSALDRVSTTSVLAGAGASIPFLTDSYQQYLAWKLKDQGLAAQLIIDGVKTRNTGMNDPRDEFPDIMSRPVMPHCKRFIWTDEKGNARTLLVCTDTEGNRRNYFNQ